MQYGHRLTSEFSKWGLNEDEKEEILKDEKTKSEAMKRDRFVMWF